MESKGSVIVLVLMVTTLCHIQPVKGTREGKSVLKEEDFELETKLKILNKPSIKIIQTEEGDVFDCVDIYKQPTLDHPLLKNHKIQLRPTTAYIPKGLDKEVPSNANETSATMLTQIHCPQETVPIRRTRKEDLLRAKSFSKPHLAASHPLVLGYPGQHLAVLRSKENAMETYKGLKANINIQNPPATGEQRSTGQLWIETKPTDKMIHLQAGWSVDPMLFGDSKTRLFTYWTADGGDKTGCFNYLCHGFVQVDKSNPIGSSIQPISQYGGRQFQVSLMIFQDPKTGNWWLIFQNIYVGYWPKELIPDLGGAGGATVAWGGVAVDDKNGASPPMGSGHFPDGHTDHACFIANLQVVDASNTLVDPKGGTLETYVDNPLCYDMKYYGYHGRLGHILLFGGPGGFCGQ